MKCSVSIEKTWFGNTMFLVMPNGERMQGIVDLSVQSGVDPGGKASVTVSVSGITSDLIYSPGAGLRTTSGYKLDFAREIEVEHDGFDTWVRFTCDVDFPWITNNDQE